MWIELTDKESEWQEFFNVGQRALHNDPFYRFTHPDPHKRRRFFPVYFEYLYNTCLKDGRGLLVVIKTRESGKVKIIGGLAVTLDEDEEKAKDTSNLLAIDEDSWRRHERREKWEWDTYICKIEELTKKLGTNAMEGIFHVIDDNYRGMGIGERFIMDGVQMMSDEVVRRKLSAGDNDPKPPLAYSIADHERSRNFHSKCGFIEVAKFRTADAEFLRELTSHIWVYLLPPQDPTWVSITRKELGNHQYKSKL